MNLLGVQLEPSFIFTMAVVGLLVLVQSKWWRERR